MSYATKQDMIDQFGEPEMIALTDRDGLGVIDDAVLNKALAGADTEINPFLVTRYILPPVTVPEKLMQLACDITCYRLCRSGVTATEDIRSRYKDAVKFLDMVLKGEISLGLDAAGKMAQESASVRSSSGSARVFTPSSLAGF